MDFSLNIVNEIIEKDEFYNLYNSDEYIEFSNTLDELSRLNDDFFLEAVSQGSDKTAKNIVYRDLNKGRINTAKTIADTTDIYSKITDVGAEDYKFKYNIITKGIKLVTKIILFIIRNITKCIRMINKVKDNIKHIPVVIRKKIKGDIELYITIDDIRNLYNNTILNHIVGFVNSAKIIAQGNTWNALLDKKSSSIKDIMFNSKEVNYFKQMRTDFGYFKNITFSPTLIDMSKNNNVEVYFGEARFKFNAYNGNNNPITYYEGLQDIFDQLSSKKDDIKFIYDELCDKFNRTNDSAEFQKLRKKNQNQVLEVIQMSVKAIEVIGNMIKYVLKDIDTINKSINMIQAKQQKMATQEENDKQKAEEARQQEIENYKSQYNENHPYSRQENELYRGSPKELPLMKLPKVRNTNIRNAREYTDSMYKKGYYKTFKFIPYVIPDDKKWKYIQVGNKELTDRVDGHAVWIKDVPNNKKRFKEYNPDEAIKEDTELDIDEFDDIEYLDEKSHGKLKYDFRIVRNWENGHPLRIVYSLDNLHISRDKTTKEKTISDRKNTEANIKKTGDTDHRSYGQKVLAIVDLATNQRLQRANCCGIFANKLLDRDVSPSKDAVNLWHIMCLENRDERDVVFSVEVGKVDMSPSFKSTATYKDMIVKSGDEPYLDTRSISNKERLNASKLRGISKDIKENDEDFCKKIIKDFRDNHKNEFLIFFYNSKDLHDEYRYIAPSNFCSNNFCNGSRIINYMNSMNEFIQKKDKYIECINNSINVVNTIINDRDFLNSISNEAKSSINVNLNNVIRELNNFINKSNKYNNLKTINISLKNINHKFIILPEKYKDFINLFNKNEKELINNLYDFNGKYLIYFIDRMTSDLKEAKIKKYDMINKLLSEIIDILQPKNIILDEMMKLDKGFYNIISDIFMNINKYMYRTKDVTTFYIVDKKYPKLRNNKYHHTPDDELKKKYNIKD